MPATLPRLRVAVVRGVREDLLLLAQLLAATPHADQCETPCVHGLRTYCDHTHLANFGMVTDAGSRLWVSFCSSCVAEVGEHTLAGQDAHR